MTSISSIDTVRPLPTPSSASSPTLEDDIAHTRAWLAHDATNTKVDHKGKSRQQYVDLSEDNADYSDSNSYPPMSDQESETRRVEETLRQWEISERHRRKTVRESTSSLTTVTPPSLLSDVTKRASHLWRTGSRKRKPSIGGKHTALGSTDNLDAVPLEDIAASPTSTPSLSPTPSSFTPLRQNSVDIEGDPGAKKKTVRSSEDDTSENPFENPATPSALEAVSPFADTHSINTDDVLQSSVQRSSSHASGKRHSRLQPPPPRPLNLPRPKSPPTIAFSAEPYPENIPDTTRNSGDDNGGNGKPVRWWHEWLCGCGEGPDRGGDSQAGRTNPFE